MRLTKIKENEGIIEHDYVEMKEIDTNRDDGNGGKLYYRIVE